MLEPDLIETLQAIARADKRVTVLAGAGISAESGIPTFRGPEGYWTVGAHEYQPQQMATQAMFRQRPDEVWAWYLYRRGVCHQAEPNAGHRALVRLEEALGDRFSLITQNVDGLHLRAGNTSERTFEIHGNLDFRRCLVACTRELDPFPEAIPAKTRGERLTDFERQLLRCPRCGSRTRPHVLWFDEYYDEEYFRFESSLRVARDTGLLIVVGTSGATNLPNQVVTEVLAQEGWVLVIDLVETRFSQLAGASGRGFFLQQPGSVALPAVVSCLSTTDADNLPSILRQ